MRIHRDLDHLRRAMFRAPSVTIGVFDGVHRGHQALFAELRDEAAKRGGEAAIVTFDRHPRLTLSGEAPPTLTSLEHRLVLFEREGIDAAVVLPFDARMAAVSAEAFVGDIVVGRIGAVALVLGENAHFGRGREGNVAWLEREKDRFGLALRVVRLVAGGGGPRPDPLAPARAFAREQPAPPAAARLAAGPGLPAGEGAGGGEVVSSTAIRKAVLEGRLEDAARMLGRPFSLLGRVERGDGRGRTLGFPTANLALHQEVCPPRGVYAARVQLAPGEGGRFPAMVNIGVRPTFAKEGAIGRDAAPPSVEAHLIGFDGSLYGRVLEVELIAKIRDERRFPSAEALVEQIGRDRETVLALRAGGVA